MIDELNIISEKIKQEQILTMLKGYFRGMEGISEEQVEDRANVGLKLFNLAYMLFSMVSSASASGTIQDIDYYIEMVSRRYTDIVADEYAIDKYLSEYIPMFSQQMINTTLENIDVEYYTSDERALSIAENEANTVVNYTDYKSAVEKGCTKKQWLTEMDMRVRKTHIAVENKIIPINEYFIVGNSTMLYPHDAITAGVEAKEIVNCRCNVRYI